MKPSISIHTLKSEDIPLIVEGFRQSNWTKKPASTFEKYLDEQDHHERIVWVASVNNIFAGYVTLKLSSSYPYFNMHQIPEIMDLNVLPNFRKNGVGTALLDHAEKEASIKSNTIGIGVGLYTDYGNAQKLYIKRGYVPDGNGVTYDYKATKPGESYRLDDDLILWFIKET